MVTDIDISKIDLSHLTEQVTPNRKQRRAQGRAFKQWSRHQIKRIRKEQAAAQQMGLFEAGGRAILRLKGYEVLVLDKGAYPVAHIEADLNRTSISQHARTVARRYGLDPSTFTEKAG